MPDAQHATLVIMCKRPLLHQGKQRLAATLGAEQALAIATGLLGCVVDDANHWPGPVVLSPSSAADKDWAADLLSRPASVIPQPEGNLGQRIQFIDQALRRSHTTRTIYIGSDAPCLTSDILAHAERALTHHDVVLSCALDGGVTLMANQRPWPILQSLPWSTSQFAQGLITLCAANDCSVKTIDTTFDVDEAPDLDLVLSCLATDPRQSRKALVNLIQDIKKGIVYA